MAAFRMLILAILLFVHQAAGAGRCSASTMQGPAVCDDSCNEVGTCTNGVWQRSVNCQESGNVCRYVSSGSTLTGTCVAATPAVANSYCTSNPFYTFKCPPVMTATAFPSLIDCTSYYVCYPGDAQVSPFQCGGRAFNSCTGSCTDPLTSGTCPTITTPYCKSVGQVGIAPGNDALYYTCDGNLQPVWGACPTGQRYSIATRSCVNFGALATCTVCAAATSAPGPLPYSGNACRYVWCHSRDNFEMRSCLSGWYYEHSARGCVYDRYNVANC